MATVPDWITHRYAHHPPQTQDRIEAHQLVRNEFAGLAAFIEELLPAGREKAMAHSFLQQAAWAANAAIALGEESPPAT